MVLIQSTGPLREHDYSKLDSTLLLASILMLIGIVAELISYYKLLSHIRHCKSIKGLSFDFIIINLLDSLSNVVYQTPYILSQRVLDLYKLRNPVHDQAIISIPLTIIEYLKLLVGVGILIQLGKNHHTRNSDQSFSLHLKGFLLINFVLVTFVLINIARNNSYTLNCLDFLETIWLSNQFYKVFKLIPQLFMNYTNSIYSLNDSFARFQLIGFVILLTAKIISLGIIWYSVPLNYYTLLSIIFNIVYCIILRCQSKSYGEQKFSRVHQN